MNTDTLLSADIKLKGDMLLIQKRLTEVLVDLAQATAACWQLEYTEAASRLVTAQGEIRMGLEDVASVRGEL